MNKVKAMARDINEALSIGFGEAEEKHLESVCNYWLKKAFIDGIKTGIDITISAVKGRTTESNDHYYQNWKERK